MEEKQGLRCGEANPNQGLRRNSGQKPNADSQRQLYKGPITPRGGRGRKRTQTAQGSRREGWRDSRGSAAARPALTRDWGGPQVRNPMPIVSVNSTKDLSRPEGAEEGKRPKQRKGAGGRGR